MLAIGLDAGAMLSLFLMIFLLGAATASVLLIQKIEPISNLVISDDFFMDPTLLCTPLKL